MAPLVAAMDVADDDETERGGLGGVGRDGGGAEAQGKEPAAGEP
jgi:hypothetical protein